MLYKGHFIKEPPPKIGIYYAPVKQREISEQEEHMLDVLLGRIPTTRWELFDVLVAFGAFYAVAVIVTGVIKGWNTVLSF